MSMERGSAASYGSSEEMLRALSAGVAIDIGVCLPTPFGGVGLDGFAEQEDRYVFVVAKDREPYHEPYSASAPYELDPAYEALCRAINDGMCGALYCHVWPNGGDGARMKVTFAGDGAPILYFDLGQMLGILSGIATGVLTGRFSHKRIEMLYLIREPDGADKQEIYDRVREEGVGIDLATLFVTVLTHLREMGVGSLSDEALAAYLCNFTFTLCDEDLYPPLLRGDF